MKDLHHEAKTRYRARIREIRAFYKAHVHPRYRRNLNK
jgi:hypothetical protein